MFALTMSVIFYLGFNRYRAIHARQVSVKFFRGYNEGEQPERLHIMARHVQNHFEIPPLFHISIGLTYITESTNYFVLGAAWCFVIGRCIHSVIHLGANNVSQRFFVFGSTLLLLTAIWVNLAISLL